MRNTLQVLPGAVAAALYAASIGIVAGILGCVLAGNLAFGIRSAIACFAIVVAGFGYARWRAYRSRRAAAFLDRWYHEDLSTTPTLDEALTYIRFTDKRRTNAKGRR